MQLAGFLGLTVVLTWPLVLQMSTSVYGRFYDSDIRGAIWQLWWAKLALARGLDYFHCIFLGAPFGVSLAHAPISWMVYTLFNVLLRFFTPAACLNLLILASFVLTGLFTSRLIFRLTQNALVSFLGAVIFTFAPYHLNKVMEFSFFFLGNWFVLFVLTLVHLRHKKTVARALVSGCALGLTAGFCPYYGFFAFIFAVFFLVYEALYGWRTRVKEATKALSWACLLLGIMVFVAAAINFNVVMAVFRSFLATGVQDHFQSGAEYFRPMDYLVAQSARPLSYLLPASTHPFLGRFTEKMFGSFFYGRGPIEQTLYLGWVPLVLSFFAYRVWKKRRVERVLANNAVFETENFWIGFFIFAAWAGFIFSLPPVLNLGIFKIHLPSYATYKVLPMFRAYARFGMPVMLCVAVLASFGVKFVLSKLRSDKLKIAFTSVVFLAILFEFINIPPARVTDITKPLPPAYSWLKDQPGDFIIAEYPMAKGSPGEALSNYNYLFGQTFHHKRLVNGLVSTAAVPRGFSEKIFLVDDPGTPAVLASLGVTYVLLHTDSYRKGARADVSRIQGDVPDLMNMRGYRFCGSFGDISIFEVTADPQRTG